MIFVQQYLNQMGSFTEIEKVVFVPPNMTQVAAGNPWSHANYTGRGAEPEPLPSQKSLGSGCAARANLCSWEDGGGGAGALGQVQAAATRSAGRTGRPGEYGVGGSGGRPASGRRRGSGERRPGKAVTSGPGAGPVGSEGGPGEQRVLGTRPECAGRGLGVVAETWGDLRRRGGRGIRSRGKSGRDLERSGEGPKVIPPRGGPVVRWVGGAWGRDLKGQVYGGEAYGVVWETLR